MNSNFLLRYSNSSWIQAIAWHWYYNHSLFIEYTDRKPLWFRLTPFHEYLLIILWWDWFFVPRSMCKINTYPMEFYKKYFHPKYVAFNRKREPFTMVLDKGVHWKNLHNHNLPSNTGIKGATWKIILCKIIFVEN